jgi:hypothetical protein
VIENENGLVSGSLDRARIKELHDQTNDAELKVYYRGLLGESEEGKSLDEGGDAEAAPESESQPTEPRASMASSKDELISQAEAAGLGTQEDLEQFTKQELVDELNANREG